MTLTELRAVRMLHTKYDENPDGRMHVSNLKPLLTV